MPDTAVSSSAQTVASSKAFETFYQREREGILRTLLFVLGEEDAVEAFETAMAQAFDDWSEVRGLDNPAGWVIRAALEAAPQRRGDRAAGEEESEDGETAADADADAAIAEALTQLALEQRAALVLRFHLDWSVEQIAEALDQPVETVKGLVYRGLSRLRTLLTEARMTTELEELLRKHFTHRSERLRLPTPAVNDELARIADGASRRRRGGPNARTSRLMRRGLLAAGLVVAVLLVAFVVAGGDEDDDPASAQDPRAATTVPGQGTQPAESPTTAVPPPQGPAVAAHPVVVGPYGELGWWDGGAWVNSQPGIPLPVQGGETYQVVGLEPPSGSRVGAFSTELCPTDPTKVGLQAVDAGYGPRESWPALVPIAVSGVADPQPRPVSVLDPGAAAYKAAASQSLATLGIQDPDPPIVQVLRTDLDADGFDDVLVVAERITNFDAITARPGDYSVMFVRRVVNDVVHTTVAAKAFPYGAPGADGLQPIDSLRVAAIADLNGDGRMEMVLQNDHPNGHATAVYELLPDGNPVAVIGRACEG